MNLLARKNWIGKRPRQLAFLAVTAIFAIANFAAAANTQQARASAAETYAGTWQAEYQGKNYIVLTLNEDKGISSGSIRMMDTQFDLKGDGGVSQITGQLSEPMPLSKIHRDGKIIFFDVTEDNDPTHWRMELTSRNDATLTWIKLPTGLKFKPVRLTRQSSQ